MGGIAEVVCVVAGLLAPCAGGAGGQAAAPTPAAPPTRSRSPVVTVDDGGDLNRAIEQSDGGTVVLAKDAYPPVTITARPKRRVTVRGRSKLSEPTLRGVTFSGASNITLADVNVAGPVVVTRDWASKLPSSSIRLDSIDVRNPPAACVMIRDASYGIRVVDSKLTGCLGGIGGPPTDSPSSKIWIEGNRISRMTADGIQFGAWKDVVIDRNVITDLSDPKKELHSDAIQVTGNASGIQITNNELTRSSGQIILLGPDYGPISDVRIQNNLLADADAYAMQAGGVSGLVIRRNTIWDSKWGLYLRSAPPGAPAPTDTVLNNNIMNHFLTAPDYKLKSNAGNLIAQCPDTGRPCKPEGIRQNDRRKWGCRSGLLSLRGRRAAVKSSGPDAGACLHRTP